MPHSPTDQKNSQDPDPTSKHHGYVISVLVIAISAWPFLSFLGGNRGQFVDMFVVFYIFAASLGTLGIICFTIHKLISSVKLRHRLINCCCVFFALLFTYGAVDNGIKSEFGVERSRFILLAWGAMALVCVGFIWIVTHGRQSTFALAAGALAMSITAATDIRLSTMQHTAFETNPNLSKAIESKALPNVYYFIFDAYGRGDTLEKYLGFDNSAFLNELENNGFEVLEQSQSNYPVTFLSLAATMNMGPLFEPGPEALKDYVGYQRLLAGYNPAVKMFKSLGYTYVHAQPGGWGGTRCQGVEDICIRAGKEWINETGLAILAMTPIEIVIRKIAPTLIVFNRTLFPFVAKQLSGLIDQIKSPIFSFAHILIPHDRIYDENCDATGNELYFEEASTLDRDADYVNTVKCLNKQISENIGLILEKDPNAIVIFQSDHGFILSPMLSLPVEKWAPQDIEMRYGILNVMRVPSRCKEDLYSSMTSFNTFRFIEGCLKGNAPSYIDDISYRAANGQIAVLPLYPE